MVSFRKHRLYLKRPIGSMLIKNRFSTPVWPLVIRFLIIPIAVTRRKPRTASEVGSLETFHSIVRMHWFLTSRAVDPEVAHGPCSKLLTVLACWYPEMSLFSRVLFQKNYFR